MEGKNVMLASRGERLLLTTTAAEQLPRRYCSGGMCARETPQAGAESTNAADARLLPERKIIHHRSIFSLCVHIFMLYVCVMDVSNIDRCELGRGTDTNDVQCVVFVRPPLLALLSHMHVCFTQSSSP